MSCDKPSLTIRGSDTVSVEGKRARLPSVNKEQELRDAEREFLHRLWMRLDESRMYDYKQGSNPPEEWSNIEWGKDQFKIKKKEWLGIGVAGVLIVGLILYSIIKLIF